MSTLDRLKELSTLDRLSIIKSACLYFNFHWPPDLTSGVMFFGGERITRREFISVSRKAKAEL